MEHLVLSVSIILFLVPCARAYFDNLASANEKKARFYFLKGKISDLTSQILTMRRVLAFLRGVHVTDVKEEGEEEVRNGVIAALDNDQVLPLELLQAMDNEALLTEAHQYLKAKSNAQQP
eukprot:m.60301 g.60301  ORF g.60301 m.60301 type:complete len:120 (+) comp11807_c0_seq2:537-896(+)